jgi:hypothetical protein
MAVSAISCAYQQTKLCALRYNRFFRSGTLEGFKVASSVFHDGISLENNTNAWGSDWPSCRRRVTVREDSASLRNRTLGTHICLIPRSQNLYLQDICAVVRVLQATANWPKYALVALMTLNPYQYFNVKQLKLPTN